MVTFLLNKSTARMQYFAVNYKDSRILPLLFLCTRASMFDVFHVDIGHLIFEEKKIV